MRVLVTGGTGLVGGAVVRELLSRGHAVRLYARATSDTASLEAAGAEVARGELDDPAAIGAALRGCEGVVHTAGVVGFAPGMEDVLEAVNVRAVETVLGAALDAGVSRAVLTSSTSVLGGTRAPKVADEATPGNAEALGLPYFVSKLRGERTALALAARGLPVVVVRPSYVLGPGDVHSSSASILVALARRRIPAYVEGGVSFCDVRDVAAGHVAALERGRAGEIYILGGHNLTMTEMMRRACAVAGVPPPRRVPVPVALGFAWLQETAARVYRRRTGMTRDLVRASALYTFVSSARAERELGYRIRPFEDMVTDTLRWAVETGRLRAETAALRAVAGGG
ncbi:NAD-dependent epimerase/dehydratase family protein [Anaeromyxobacter oryzae]|uniref:NAD-dependent dehydratase n=1 Tax=Anaeromyxobacter oryzae TaxID=2918170 RepID=A0ABN6MTZ9_9BACT|nr:NAD-dependent epimerase/dehydratase family protein [Anaeromyxobacter oryzae]BDG04448.1 NAD-dependent dehydratase [Anaeromyxobacter oryzae]